MPIPRALLKSLTVALALAGTGACSSTPPLRSAAAPAPVETGAACATRSVRIDFDFDEAPASRCVIRGERAFSIVIGPEHGLPINPSPWYAFHYVASGGEEVAVRLEYIGAKHRYTPRLTANGTITALAAQPSKDRSSADLVLPAGEGIVSGQELFGAARYAVLLDRLAALPSAEKITLGASLDGRALAAVRVGDRAAPNLVVLIGREHPPEVTGALAMEGFLHELADRIAGGAVDLGRVQFLIVPMMNPDGVARGHWRANRGGVDLNRDWGAFTQPETRAVADWLGELPRSVKPVVMVDFHSTWENLFYVQAEGETDAVQERFLADWLGGKGGALPGYPFTIERRNANPGSGTSKNWFHAEYAIPAYTYEVGDETDRAAIAASARVLARDFLAALDTLIG